MTTARQTRSRRRRRRPASPLTERLARARLVQLRRRENPFGWIALTAALTLASLPASPVTRAEEAQALLLVPRLEARVPIAAAPGPRNVWLDVDAGTGAAIAENDWLCVQRGSEPLAWYRVLRKGHGPVPADPASLPIRVTGAGAPRLVGLARPVEPPFAR